MRRRNICSWILSILSVLPLCGQNGFFNVVDPVSKSNIITHAKTVFVCDGKSYSTSDLKLFKQSESVVSSTLGSGNLHRYKYKSDDGLEFWVDFILYKDNSWTTINGWVKNTTNHSITFNNVTLLDALNMPNVSGDWKQTRVLCGTTDKLVWLGDVLNEKDKHLSARSFTCLYNKESKEEYTMGFSIKQAWGSFNYDFSQDSPHFTANVMMDVDLRPGELRQAEAVHIKKGNVWDDLRELITATGKEVGAITNGHSFSGWCSWYGFNPFIDNDITEDVVTDFANSAGKMKDLPLDLMLLDDGYFTLPGDWTTLRPFFPHGMRYLTDVCKRNGLIPGIWVAATLVHENSNIMKNKEMWVDKEKDGTYHNTMFNWGGKTHSFDATNKEFLNHIDTLFRYITHNWGFRYLKLDFNLEPGSNRFDRTITSFQAIRNFYKVIKNAVGDSVFIANCADSPFPPCIGIAKAGRVGPDVNPNWASVLAGCRSSILHIPFHHRWWANDPDCLNMREKRSQLSEDELRTHITANFMGGGNVLFSDSIEELTPERKVMLAQALPPSGKSAEIVDYMTAPESGIPSLFYYPVNRFNEKSAIVTLFNWGEKSQSRKIDMSEVGLEKDKDYYVYDFWTDTYKGIHRNDIVVENQKAHACALMAIRPVEKDQIQVISTSLHLLQGEKEITGITRMVTSPFDAAKAEMWLEITPVSLHNGKIILASPDGLHIAAVQGSKALLSKRADGLWDLHLSDMKDKVAVLLRVR